MEIIKLLLPPLTKEKSLMQFHSTLEGKYKKFSLKNYHTELMGLTAKEVSFREIYRYA